MNQKEKSYVLLRITAITNDKLAEAREQATHQGIQLSLEEKLDRLSTGNFTLKPRSEYNSYGQGWYNYVDFGEQQRKVDSELQTKLAAQINKDATELKDQVMLGKENDEVLKLLTSFQNKKYS